MSFEENKTIIRRLMEAVSKRDLAVLDELVAPNFVEHTFLWKGLESMKQTVTMLFKGFPDLHVSVEDITTEGDKVWDRVTVTGTHTGEYRGIPPTGKKITFTGIRIWRIVDGARADFVNDTWVLNYVGNQKHFGFIPGLYFINNHPII